MTLDLEAIKARCEAATDDEWFCEPEVYFPGSQLPGGDPPYGEPAAVKGKHGWIAQYVLSTADADFITHARTDVPALLAEVERLNGIINRYQLTKKALANHTAFCEICETNDYCEVGDRLIKDHIIAKLNLEKGDEG